MSKLALRAQTVDIACLPLRQDFLAKNVLMAAQRDLVLGNSLFMSDPIPDRKGNGDPKRLKPASITKICNFFRRVRK